MPPEPHAEKPAGPVWIPLGVILAAVAAAYANALGAAFQFDDWNVIVSEPRVQTLAAWWASMPGIRPLLKLSYAMNHALAPGAWGFHAVNVALHAANALLAFALLSRLAARQGLGERSARVIALVGSLIFALHPLQTEAVTYASGRSSSLAAFFCLASLLAWSAAHPGGRRSLVALSVASFGAALLVKETAMVLPLALLLWESAGASPGSPRPIRVPWAHFGVLAAGAFAALASPMYRHLLSASLAARGLGANLLTQANAIAYLALGLLRFDRLNADPALPVLAAWGLPVALQATAILALIGIGIACFRRHPAVAFGILWFFLWLAPTNSLLPRLDVANDRQLYLPLLGPAWLVAWALARLLPKRRAAAISAVLLLAIPLGIATHRRHRVYADEIVFWEDVTRKSPRNSRAFNNLGYAYALGGRNEKAQAAFRRALELDPDDVTTAVNLRLLREGALVRQDPRRPDPRPAGR